MARPPVLLDIALPDFLRRQIDSICEIWPWSLLETGSESSLSMVEGVYTYAHPDVDEALFKRLPNLKVVSNFGVGVDHIDLVEARDADSMGHATGRGGLAEELEAGTPATVERKRELERRARGRPNFREDAFAIC